MARSAMTTTAALRAHTSPRTLRWESETLGLSNISFGLNPASRVVLNSAFLHYALEAGLTSAIVHGSKILPENKIDSEVWKISSDLVFDKREYESA